MNKAYLYFKQLYSDYKLKGLGLLIDLAECYIFKGQKSPAEALVDEVLEFMEFMGPEEDNQNYT